MSKLNEFAKSSIFPWFGIIGTIITSLGCIIAAIGYVGTSGESYTILRYFISELGAVKTSELAIAFNVGVSLGGSMLTVFMLGLYGHFTTKIGKFAGILGTFAGISGALVGIYPMDVDISMHGLVAMGFFYGGMITVVLMTIGLFLDKTVHNSFFVKGLGILSGVFFFIFNIVLGQYAAIFSESNTQIDPATMSMDAGRPAGIWWMAVFEWLSLLGMLVWIFVLGLEMKLKNKKIN